MKTECDSQVANKYTQRCLNTKFCYELVKVIMHLLMILSANDLDTDHIVRILLV